MQSFGVDVVKVMCGKPFGGMSRLTTRMWQHANEVTEKKCETIEYQGDSSTTVRFAVYYRWVKVIGNDALTIEVMAEWIAGYDDFFAVYFKSPGACRYRGEIIDAIKREGLKVVEIW